MSWDILNGYVPRTFQELLNQLTTSVNEQFGTSYTTTTIQGTNIYKYFYGGIQAIMELEQSVTDLSSKMQVFIAQANEKILQPRGTADGFIEFVKDDGILNAQGSFNPILTEEQRGNIKFAIELDPTNAQFSIWAQTLANYMHKYLSVGLYYFSDVGPLVHFKGMWDVATEYVENDVVIQGQVFYKATATTTGADPLLGAPWELVTGIPDNFHWAVVNAINAQPFFYGFYTPRYGKLSQLQITLPISRNKNSTIPSQETIQNLFVESWNKIMVLGANLEPEVVLNAQTIGFASRVEYTGIYTDPDNNEIEFDNEGLAIPFDVKIQSIDPDEIVVVYA